MSNRSDFDRPFSEVQPIFSNPSTTSTQYRPWCHGRSFFGLDFGGMPFDDCGGSAEREDDGEEST